MARIIRNRAIIPTGARRLERTYRGVQTGDILATETGWYRVVSPPSLTATLWRVDVRRLHPGGQAGEFVPNLWWRQEDTVTLFRPARP